MLILLLLLPQPLLAARMLDLDGALAIAMERNRDIAGAREYARYVEGKYVEERAAALPQLSLNASSSMARDNGQPAFAGGGTNQYDNYVGVALAQPLFTWGKIGAAIRAAEIGRQTAAEQLRLARQAVRRNVVACFCEVLLARDLAALARETLSQKQRHQAEVQKKFAAGVATDYDLLAANVALENARPGVIKSDNSLKLARERLRFLLALDEEVDAVGSLEVVPAGIPELAEVLREALVNRPELRDLALRIGIYGELVTIAAADDKPRLDLKAGAGWHQLEMMKERNDGTSWQAGVYLTFPFFDGLRTAGRVEQARSDLASREIERQKLLDSIRLEARNARHELEEAGEIVAALAATVSQAERLLQMAEKGYEFGVKTRLEVDDAQTNLVQARTNRSRALADYRKAGVNLDWVMGRLGE